MDGWALMESFKGWILGFSDSVKFLGTKIGYEEVTIGRLDFERRAWGMRLRWSELWGSLKSSQSWVCSQASGCSLGVGFYLLSSSSTFSSCPR